MKVSNRRKEEALRKIRQSSLNDLMPSFIDAGLYRLATTGSVIRDGIKISLINEQQAITEDQMFEYSDDLNYKSNDYSYRLAS